MVRKILENIFFKYIFPAVKSALHLYHIDSSVYSFRSTLSARYGYCVALQWFSWKSSCSSFSIKLPATIEIFRSIRLNLVRRPFLQGKSSGNVIEVIWDKWEFLSMKLSENIYFFTTLTIISFHLYNHDGFYSSRPSFQSSAVRRITLRRARERTRASAVARSARFFSALVPLKRY